MWINGTGHATTPDRTESAQAHWWARAIATFVAGPRIEHIGIYEINDAPRDRPVLGDASAPMAISFYSCGLAQNMRW